MGDHQNRARIFLQVVFQPFDTFGIQVVGRFVEQKDGRLLEEKAGQRDTALFTAGQVLHRPVRRRAPQRFHRDFQLVVERPAVHSVNAFLQRAHFFHQRVEIGVGLSHQRGDFVIAVHHVSGFARAVLDVFKDVLGRVELRLLLQIADGDVLARPGFAQKFGVDAGHDLDQRRFTGAVRADDADLRTLIKLQIDIAQNRLLGTGERLGHVFHDIGVLRGHGSFLSSVSWRI